MQNALSVRRMAQIAVLAAVLAVLSQISFPMPSGVPVTLQTLAVSLCGFVLGPALGAMAVGLYILLGAIGLPVFSNFSGGFGSLIGVTGGFIWGFLPFAALCGFGIRNKPIVLTVLLSLLGLVLCHVLGILQFSLVKGESVLVSASLVSLPYLVKDVLSVIGAYLISLPVNRALDKAGLR